MTHRRTFLRTVAGAAAAAVLPRGLRAARPPRLASRIERVGLELYTVRSEMAKSVEATLETVAQIGYREVEFAGYFGREPAALRATLDRLGLSAPACHVPGGLPPLETRFDLHAGAAKTLGHHWLIVASPPSGAFRSIEAVKDLAARFNAVGRRAYDADLRFGYHNHGPEFKPVDGKVPFDVLLEETDPALVNFELDLYWIAQGGGDALAYLTTHRGRFHLVHVKDSGGPPAHEMRDVGAGTIPWKTIFARHREAGIQHYFVEHDRPSDPFASAKASYEYLKALEF